MFERFTESARQVVTDAQAEARRLHHPYIGTEHLLLALLGQATTTPGRILVHHGLDHDRAAATLERLLGTAAPDPLDADLLDKIGIDLGAVREKVVAAFGPGALDRRTRGVRGPVTGHIPFSKRAKKVLELSLREALALKHNHIADGHILLGMLREGEGLAAQIIADAGIDFDTLRAEIKDELA
jgi:ATP-dependent Clp protease ATP-binding subunit ClpA